LWQIGKSGLAGSELLTAVVNASDHENHRSDGETSMLRIYGWKRSRVVRCMWVMEELGLEYEQIPLNPNEGQTRTPDYLALNPQGKIPTLVHDDFVLSETMAINIYLARSFPGSLWPSTAKGVAKVHQWTSWAISELEPPLVAIMREGRRPAEQIDQSRVDGWRGDVHRMVDAVLEPVLGRQPHLLADGGFSLADLNVAAVASVMPIFEIGLSGHPHTDQWMKRCFSRDAWRRVMERP
jgi:glutathione S-transferase